MLLYSNTSSQPGREWEMGGNRLVMSDLVFSLITSSAKLPTIVTKKQYQLSWESHLIRGDCSAHTIAIWHGYHPCQCCWINLHKCDWSSLKQLSKHQPLEYSGYRPGLHLCFHKVKPRWLFGPSFVLRYSTTLKPKSLTLRISSTTPLIWFVSHEYSPFPIFIYAVVGLLLFFSEGEGEGTRGMGKQLKSWNQWRSRTRFHLKGGEVHCYCTVWGAPLKSASWRHSSLPVLGSGVPTWATHSFCSCL